MDFEKIRHIARWVVNIGGIVLLILQSAQFGAMFPDLVSLPVLVTIIAGLNQVISFLKRWTDPVVPAPTPLDPS